MHEDPARMQKQTLLWRSVCFCTFWTAGVEAKYRYPPHMTYTPLTWTPPPPSLRHGDTPLYFALPVSMEDLGAPFHPPASVLDHRRQHMPYYSAA